MGNTSTDMEKDFNSNLPAGLKDKLQQIRDNLCVTKISCSRSVKGVNGDSFVAFAASWKSVQEDNGGVASLDSKEETSLYVENGWTLKDARLARYLLSLECDVAALESALANGSITPAYFEDAIRGVHHNYNLLILQEFGDNP